MVVVVGGGLGVGVGGGGVVVLVGRRGGGVIGGDSFHCGCGGWVSLLVGVVVGMGFMVGV